MKGFAIAASLAAALSAAPVFAQAAGQAKPAQPKPAQPAAPAPAQPPSLGTPPPAAQPPAPFPVGAKIAYFNPQRAFQESIAGKAALARVKALTDKKQSENAARTKDLADKQQKLQTSGSVMNEAARSQLEKEIEKDQVDVQRFQQDAQSEIQELQQEVQNDFLKKLQPIVDQIATEKQLHLVFNASEAGLAWAVPGLDLTTEIIQKLDASAKPATAPKQ